MWSQGVMETFYSSNFHIFCIKTHLKTFGWLCTGTVFPLRAAGPVLLVLPSRAPTTLGEGQAVWAHLGGGGRLQGESSTCLRISPPLLLVELLQPILYESSSKVIAAIVWKSQSTGLSYEAPAPLFSPFFPCLLQANDSDLVLLTSLPLSLLDSGLCWWISFLAAAGPCVFSREVGVEDHMLSSHFLLTLTREVCKHPCPYYVCGYRLSSFEFACKFCFPWLLKITFGLLNKIRFLM